MTMRKWIFFLLAAAALAGTSAAAADGIECALAVYQHDIEEDRSVLLFCDTNQFAQDISATGFLAGFSIDMEVLTVDTGRCQFNLHVVTLGPPADTYSRKFTVEYGLPARIDSIRGKNQTLFALEMTPLGQVEIDTAYCPYDHHAENVFKFDPSANADIYYLPNSLGDFYWAMVKGVLEDNYRRFAEFCHFNQPGKYNIFLCPCYMYSVIWDQRFGMAIDPTRRTAHAIFTRPANAAEPFIINHTALLKNYGYAPPFLSEGLASYFTLPVYDAREIIKSAEAPSIADLMDTYTYYTADPWAADRLVASFVSFLVDKYGLGTFRKCYDAADDLSLAATVEKTYGVDLGSLESDWKTYLDTLTISIDELQFHANLAEAMFNFPLMLRYGEGALAQATTDVDSLRSLSMLKRSYFFVGDYYRATEVQQALAELRASDAGQWMTLGAYKMMNGLYDEAYADLQHARSLDTADNLIVFNLARYHLNTGDVDKATELLMQKVNDLTLNQAGSESLITLANIWRQSEDTVLQARAKEYYSLAIRSLQSTLQAQTLATAVHVWLGVAYVGLGETATAQNYLEGALFLELRPFYLAMAHLWLGKIADLEGNREKALDHYSQVLALPSAAYHQAEAERYVKEPYSQ